MLTHLDILNKYLQQYIKSCENLKHSLKNIINSGGDTPTIEKHEKEIAQKKEKINQIINL